jgi:hypothetical protein
MYALRIGFVVGLYQAAADARMLVGEYLVT